MSKRIALKVEPRDHRGSKRAAKLRAGGRLPAVVYGHGQPTVSIALDYHDFYEALHHGHRIFDLDGPDGKDTVLVKDLQYDHLGRNIIHADLLRVNLQETVTVSVALEPVGTAKGAHEGGIIEHQLTEIEIECKVSEIPEFIKFSIKNLEVNGAIHAGDIELPAGMKLATPADTIVAVCHVPAAVKSTEEIEEEAPAAPEVITERKQDQQEEKEQ